MADVCSLIISAVACVAPCFSPSVGHRIHRWREFKSNFKSLKTKVKTLKAERTSIQRRVNLAKENGDGIEDNVQNWLERAEEIEVKILKWLERASKIIGDDHEAGKARKDEKTAATGEIGGDAEIVAQQQGQIREDIQVAAPAAREIGEGEETVAAAGKLRADEEKTVTKKRCVEGLCPNLKLRYQLSKEAEKLLEDVKHLEVGKFDNISYIVIPKDPRLSIKDYLAFESRASTLNDVIKSLSDRQFNIVGIHGMGGVGKTTLAKKVANQIEASKLFDSVIFVEVTDKPDITKIQKEIAAKFPDLTFLQEETESSRAAKLCRRLENKKNILIILDNIWAEINLQEIGISLGDGCKLLLTARSLDVLSTMMDDRQIFKVELLDDEEAWRLFKKMYRENIEGSEFVSVARKVVKKCAHLPISIVTVAKALRGKQLPAWRNASRRLDIQCIHASMKLSFDYLETEQLKRTILLIAYANITSIDKLLMHGMGLALFEDINDMEGRCDRVLTLVDQLKDSCLLLDSNARGEDFSMHDVVHEVATSIACEDSQLITKIQSLDENALKVCHSIVLKDVPKGKLPQVLECQHLKLLSISNVRSHSLKVHDQFFTRMTELEVLVLDGMDLLLPQPSSLRLLTNLRALGLYDCELDDITNIGYLKYLEILSLKGSTITMLPVEVGHLTRLKLLDLRGCLDLDVIPPYVLSSLSHLEELYMGDFREWEEAGLNKDRKNASLDELKDLSNLTCLQIKIEDAKTIPRDLSFNKLERYRIRIGQCRSMFHEDWILKSCRKFSLSLTSTNICLNDGQIMQLKKTEDLRLSGSHEMENVLYGLDRDGFQQLKYLRVTYNDNLLCIVDAMMYPRNNAFPVLEALLIENLINLEKICRNQLTTESSFSQLRMIKVRDCWKLKNIFSLSIARRLQRLQSIDVDDCKSMTEIFAIEREDESSCNISEVIDSIKLSQLRSLILRSLPQLKSLECNSNCSNTLFSEKIALPSLEVLKLSNINVERIWQNPATTISCGIKNLTELTIRDCNNLKYLFSSSMIRSFDQLKYLAIEYCPALEEIMVIDDEDGLRKEGRKINKSCGIQNLTELTIVGCDNLKYLFSSSIIGSFDQLRKLYIRDCPALEEIMVIDDEDGLREEGRKKNVAFSICNINNYLEMTVLYCDKLKTLFPRNMYREFLRLKSLSVYSCKLLEVIFDLEDPDFNDERSAVTITQLNELRLQSLPKLNRVWNKDLKRFVSFEKLKEVSIFECDVLKNVFPASVARSLSQLERFDISKCGVEEIVFVVDEEAETNSKFVFPRLISLALSHLPKFATFFSGRYTAEWRASFLIEKIFPNLEKLFVQGKIISTLLEFSGDFTCKMRLLDIDLDESIVISSLDFLQRFHSIKKLNIGGTWNCHFIGKNEKTLNIRYLNHCSDLKHILKEECNMDHLIHLNVQDCENLVNLFVPSLTSFRNLTTLVVYHCHALANIVTASTAKSMGQLRDIEIKGCNMLTEFLLADEGDDIKNNEIVFGKLEKLHFEELKSLTSFCSANYTLKFPSLENLLVTACPQMKSLFGGNLSTPKLQKVKHCRDQAWEKFWGRRTWFECWNGDLNTTIQQLYRGKQMMCSNNVEVYTEDEDEEDVIGSSNVYERHQLTITGAKEDIPSSSNNVQMMCNDNDEVDTE